MNAGPNLERMIRLVNEFFSSKDDPDQISVTSEEQDRLLEIHPATLSEESDENGPVAWVLVLPTTGEVMGAFLEKRISERQLLERTPIGADYDALYLCSALVLPEYRRKGLALRLTVDAVRAIQRDHPVGVLFYWSFSEEGRTLAEAVARETQLPLRERPASQ